MSAGNNIYAVIDTNVLVSALYSGQKATNPAIIIKAILSGDITPLYSEEILDEYREVLSRSKFNFSYQQISNVLDVFPRFGIECKNLPEVPTEDFLDADDIVFYRVSLSEEDSYLVTGNAKHYPKTPRIISPKEMVELLGR